MLHKASLTCLRRRDHFALSMGRRASPKCSENDSSASASARRSPSLSSVGSEHSEGPSKPRPPISEEKYALFTPAEIFSSLNLRRLDAIAVDMPFADAYALLTPDWYLDRRDVNEPHSSEWAPFVADFWCSSDSGKTCFLPVSDAVAQRILPGQYHKAVGEDWRFYSDGVASPGNVGGFHGCCVDTGQPGSTWTLVARLADFGLVLDRAAGVRVEFAALVRNDSENLVASLGAHDECRALFRIADVSLPTGKLLLIDPADVDQFSVCLPCGGDPPDEPVIEDGPCVPTGLGAGYYPILISRDSSHRICRISLVFHPTRALKIPKTFPPKLQSGRSKPPIPRPKEACSKCAQNQVTTHILGWSFFCRRSC